MQRVYDAYIGGWWDWTVLWIVVDKFYGASKWGWIFPIGWMELAEEEGPLSQLG